MLNQLRPALVLTVLFIVLSGIAYPLTITGIAQAVMPSQANGSLIRNGDVVVGSSLIGQNFTEDRYFWPRPSVTADAPYNAASSTGSNLGTTSAKLVERVKADVDRLHAAGVQAASADAVMASGSGLDPHISPDFARAQVARIAMARGMPDADVAAMVDRMTLGRLLGVIGEPRVNVLQINLALDEAKP